MIKEEQVLIKINLRNISHYLNLGYIIDNFNMKDGREINVKVSDIPKKSHFKVTAICEICNGENKIPLQKYYANLERNNKGYYSCFNCKNLEKEKTCLKKYGVKSYSQTEEFKNLDKSNWNCEGGYEKAKKNRLEKYGVEYYFELDSIKEHNRKWMSSDEFKQKSKNTLIEKYGVDSYSKTDDFKKSITENKDEIVAKIKKTFLEKYGFDWSSKVPEIISKISKTKVENGYDIPEYQLSEFDKYRKKVRNLTNKVLKQLYENWDGYDFYDGEYIKGNFSYSSTNSLYPSVDHKLSVYHGFINGIEPEKIAGIDNLCITKRYINSTKRQLTDKDFIAKQTHQ